MIIGVVTEIKTDENRVALTPAGAREFSGMDIASWSSVARGWGRRSATPTTRPTARPSSRAPMTSGPTAICCSRSKSRSPTSIRVCPAKKDQVLFTYLHLAASRECTEALVRGGNVAIAYETVRLADNTLPLLTPMSEVAGRMATLMGAHHLMRPGGGHGTLIAGVPGVAPPTSR